MRSTRYPLISTPTTQFFFTIIIITIIIIIIIIYALEKSYEVRVVIMVSVNKSISMKLEDAPVFAKFEALAKKEGYHSSSAYIVDLIKKEVKEHSESHNPQTVIDMFDRETVKAIPNIYSQDEEAWVKFYKMLTPKEYDELSKRIAWLANLHDSAKIL